MRILQLHREEMYPPESGGERRLWETAKKLSEFGPVTVVTPYPSEEPLPGAVSEQQVLSGKLAKKPILIDGWTVGMALGRYNPIDVAVRWRTVSDLTTRYGNLNFDVLFCEAPQFFSAAIRLKQSFDVRLVTTFHNAWHVLFEDHLRVREVPAALSKLVNRNVAALERKVIRASDSVVFQSQDDRARYNVSAVTNDIVIPNGCDYRELTNGDPDGVAERHGLDPERFYCVLLGSYHYGPNREAAAHLMNRIAPQVLDVEFLLVGRESPSPDIKNAHALGFVHNLSSVLAFADCGICPLTTGSGTKLKMLDYFGAGLPTVTTPTGAQGLPVTDGVHCLVRDIEAFPAAIKRLKSDPRLAEDLAKKGEEIGRQYDWSNLMERYDEVFQWLHD